MGNTWERNPGKYMGEKLWEVHGREIMGITWQRSHGKTWEGSHGKYKGSHGETGREVM